MWERQKALWNNQYQRPAIFVQRDTRSLPTGLCCFLCKRSAVITVILFPLPQTTHTHTPYLPSVMTRTIASAKLDIAPSSIYYIPDFITPAEEQTLIDKVPFILQKNWTQYSLRKDSPTTEYTCRSSRHPSPNGFTSRTGGESDISHVAPVGVYYEQNGSEREPAASLPSGAFLCFKWTFLLFFFCRHSIHKEKNNWDSPLPPTLPRPQKLTHNAHMFAFFHMIDYRTGVWTTLGAVMFVIH